MINKAQFTTEGEEVFIVNLLLREDIKVYNVRKKGKECRFSVKNKDVEKTKRMLADHDKTFVCSDNTFLSLLKNNVKRIGLYVGLAVIIFFAAEWSSFVTETRVSGNELVSTEKIIEAIKPELEMPVKKKNVDLKDAELKIIGIDGVSNASLEIKGNILFINILEELYDPKIVDFTEKKDIISQYDGIVTSILTINGSQSVSEGQTVKKGDVLISSKVIDQDGNISETHALGIVYGRVWLSEELIFADVVKKTVRTGKSTSYIVNEKFKGMINSPYLSYETEESEYNGNDFFPVKLKKITFFETAETEEKFDYNANKEKIISEAFSALEDKIPTAAKKTQKWFIEKTVDKNTVLDIYYEIIVNLAK